ncbi:MAG: hypothetical protein ACI8WB_002344 [Phenylobacterium sp.]|jgi:hypothetical protein
MQDITSNVKIWIACCRDVWGKWFVELEDGEDEFLAVEEALLSALVLAKIEGDSRPSIDKFYEAMKATYKIDINDFRSVCSIQKAGNTYCKSEKIVLSKAQEFDVKSIDSIGVILDGIPYVELQLEVNKFILEPVESLNVFYKHCEIKSEIT